MILGFTGGALPENFRRSAAIILGSAAIVLGTLNVAGRFERAYDLRDRETPKRWLDGGVVQWAMLNGLVLGLGVTTRVGYWLWYAVPITCLLSGEPLLGALVFGVYGLVRTGIGPLALFPVLSRLGSENFVARLTALRRRLLFAQGAVLVGVGVWFVLW